MARKPSKKTRTLKTLVAVALLATFLTAIGPASAVEPAQIEADINTDIIAMWFWPNDASVTVTVWDSPAKGTQLFTEVVVVAANFAEATYPGLAPGQYVVATDGVTTNEVTLVAISGVIDPVKDTVSGTAPPNASMFVDTADGCRGGVTSDNDGNWSVDFSVDPGNNPDCAQIVDLGMGPGRIGTAVPGVLDPGGGGATKASLFVPDFPDSYGSIFVEQIAWMATQGITLGCNPPTNDEYCPDNNVTRGQMAAFLVRALGLTDSGAGDLFTDDDASIFESDIDKLATAGITLGCNPPANDRFCPDNNVTRGQMAAFLQRALG